MLLYFIGVAVVFKVTAAAVVAGIIVCFGQVWTVSKWLVVEFICVCFTVEIKMSNGE